MKSIIISKEYWPKLQNEKETFNLHPILAQAHVDFSKQYSALKAPRKLKWKHNLGIVICLWDNLYILVDLYVHCISLVHNLHNRALLRL